MSLPRTPGVEIEATVDRSIQRRNRLTKEEYFLAIVPHLTGDSKETIVELPTPAATDIPV